jgi:hypothetical protein
MKKGLLIFIAALMLPMAATAQSNNIDEIFNRYSSVDGATYVNLSGTMIEFFINRSGENKLTELANRISDIRILTFSNAHDSRFFQTVTGELQQSAYTELMHIRDGGEQFLFLAEMDDDHVSELLISAGGPENVLIRIRGNMSLDNVNGLSGSSSMNLLNGFGIRR